MRRKVFVVFLIFALALCACGEAPAVPQASVATPIPSEKVVFADPQLEMLFQAAWKENANNTTYTEEQYRQMIAAQEMEGYETIFATEFEKAERKFVYVQASQVIALKGGVPAWLYALAASVATTTIIAMEAQMATNLNLPVVTIPANMKISVPAWVVVGNELDDYPTIYPKGTGTPESNGAHFKKVFSATLIFYTACRANTRWFGIWMKDPPQNINNWFQTFQKNADCTRGPTKEEWESGIKELLKWAVNLPQEAIDALTTMLSWW
jgi:hypothetical protein